MQINRLSKLALIVIMMSALQGCDESPKSGPLDGRMIYCEPANGDLPTIFSFSEGKVFMQTWMIISDKIVDFDLAEFSDDYFVFDEIVRWDTSSSMYELPRDSLQLEWTLIYKVNERASITTKQFQCQSIKTQEQYYKLVNGAQIMGETILEKAKSKRKL